jgi:hypothetical protein
LKNIFLFLLILIHSFEVFSQEKIWLDTHLKFTDNKKDANYYLISQESDSSGYSINIYRLNKTLLMAGNAADPSGIRLNGLVKWYHENGSIESEGYYNDGSKTGVWKRFNKDGSVRPNRVYSDVNMNNYIFNSALDMPIPSEDIADFNSYVKEKLIEKQAVDIITLMPVNIQFIVYRDGHIGEIKIDDKLSVNQHQLLKSIIASMPSWIPGSNGTQTINVRIGVVLDNR